MSEATPNEPTVEAPSAEAPAQDTASKTFTQDELTEAVESARKQEKDKLYSRLTEVDEARATLDAEFKAQKEQLDTLLAEREAAQKDQEQKRLESLTVEERVAERLASLEQREQQLQSQLERVAEESAKRIRESELKAYRANKLAESGVTLTELVNGNSEAEIDAAILSAKQREEAIFNRAREQVRGELQAQMPRPAAPPEPVSPSQRQLVDPRDKYKIADMNSADFQKLRDELLAQARQITGRG